MPPDTIMQAYYRLMASPERKLPPADTVRVATVCDLFLDYSEKHHAEGTYRGYRDYLQDFCELYGTLLAKDLKPLHVTRWLDTHPGWKGSRRNAVIAVKRAFNWADAEGVLQPNPVKAVKKPPQRHRDRVLTFEEREEILRAIPDRHFREFVFAMQETGARPGEVRRVTAAHVNLDLGVWAFKEHKTAKRTGRPRVIYLTPAMVELTRRLVEKYPEGPLFRGPRSKRGFRAMRRETAGSSSRGGKRSASGAPSGGTPSLKIRAAARNNSSGTRRAPDAITPRPSPGKT
jgi:integrase